jgi:hypothetical protein
MNKHLSKLIELEQGLDSLTASGTLSPQKTHDALNAITYCSKARRSIECCHNMEGAFYLEKAQTIYLRLLEK